MSDTTHCPQCGLMLAPNAPGGLCPGCLFKGALESQGSMTDGSRTADGFGEVPPAPEALAADFPSLEIIRFIGRGGMGMVYQARQKQLDRVVALKILSPRIAKDPAFAERFAREARMMALLTHPHVVSVYEFGTSEPRGDRDVPLYYLLMEFIDGLTLRQLLDASQLTPPQAFAIVPQICEALQFAHDKGVVHRDIKPENILLNRQGNVKIADFGLAKMMGLQGRDVTISTTGQILGTLHYMAPEQMERPLEVDHRADIYSLGVVFYQMLTGELPLGRFAPPSQKVQIDVRLDEVVMRALEREPGRRYQAASAFQSQVETIAMTPSVVSQTDPRSADLQQTSRMPRQGRSRIRLAVIALGLICVTLGCLSFVSIFRHKSGNMVSLPSSPPELGMATKVQVIAAGIKDPLSPWAWQELERRTLTADDADAVIDGVSEWFRQRSREERPPISWFDQLLKKLEREGLMSEQRKINLLEALHGDLRGERTIRMREGTQQLQLDIPWRWIWDRNLLDMRFMNEMQSATLDDEALVLHDENSHLNWGGDRYWSMLKLPQIKPGKHTLHFVVLSALVLVADVEGLRTDAPSEEWPPARKRWTRTMDMELTVFAEGDEIVSLIQDPSLDPKLHGLKVESVIIRRHGARSQAAVKLNMDRQTGLIPLSFDVSLQIEGQSIPCGSQWVCATQGGMTGNVNGILTAEIPQIAAEIQEADVVLTPNPIWIELQPKADRMWGKEVVFRNVPLRRLDVATSESNDPNVKPND